jgi:hypothetical protein
MTEAADVPEEIQLAVGYVDYYALARGFAFVLGIPLGFLIFARLGKIPVFVGYLVAMSRWVPAAVIVGLLLSLLDTSQVRRHRAACADIERARRLASKHLFSGSLQRGFRDANRHHRRELMLESLAPFLPVVVFGLIGGLLGAVWLLAVAFGTEWLCWRLIWRRRLLERATKLKMSSANSGAPSPSR